MFEPNTVLDIEDLVAEGRKHSKCPYFMTKKRSELADIVLLPYNYIIDKDSREANNFDLSVSKFIFSQRVILCVSNFSFKFFRMM